MIRQTAHVETAPEARKPCPDLSPKPDRRMSEDEVFNGWADDRTARNICEARRAAAIAAIDSANHTANDTTSAAANTKDAP